jgi:phosphoribosylaminoimidazole-succinocarboxamide synthase
MKFKDDVTGTDGVFDPGANSVGLAIHGAGKSNLKMSKYFFEVLKEYHIPTHYVEANLAEGTMTVQPAKLFGKGLEVICRYRAVGSFLRRYGLYAEVGQSLDGLVEFTLKDDARQDPPITEDTLVMLGILSAAEYKTLKALTVKVSHLIKEDLRGKGIELYDIKLEFGRIGADQKIAVIDEISGGNMRAYQGDKYLEPLVLAELVVD